MRTQAHSWPQRAAWAEVRGCSGDTLTFLSLRYRGVSDVTWNIRCESNPRRGKKCQKVKEKKKRHWEKPYRYCVRRHLYTECEFRNARIKNFFPSICHRVIFQPSRDTPLSSYRIFSLRETMWWRGDELGPWCQNAYIQIQVSPGATQKPHTTCWTALCLSFSPVKWRW